MTQPARPLSPFRQQLPVLLIAAGTLASAVFRLHWGISAAVSVAGLMWLVVVRKVRIPKVELLIVGYCVACLLLIQLAPLSPLSQKVVSGFLAAGLLTLLGRLLYMLWELTVLVFSVRREAKAMLGSLRSGEPPEVQMARVQQHLSRLDDLVRKAPR